MPAYNLVAQYFGTARVLRSYTLNKYKRNVLQCSCGLVFERNNNKLMNKGKVVKEDVCPACRHSNARHTLASVYKDSYLWKRWDALVKRSAKFGSAYNTGGSIKGLVELDPSVKDFFAGFFNIVDRSAQGYFLIMPPAQNKVSLKNLVWSRHTSRVQDPMPVVVHSRKLQASR
jgi:hypothetical protein